ncbi:type VII secretion system-associated protein [Streptomyces sp. HB132]|uniref:type VII secretion system-associated protein n=1 Tax=Streptomyces sp. HB132 TaxID=767388 RepID=UPI0019620882|nr:type VII secretion system-associated protein [Streptomyces sp. HB132]
MRPGERQEGANSAPFVMPEASDPAVEPGAVTGHTVAADTSGIPEAVKAAARRAPGHWVGVVDPEWTEERTPAEWAVLGEWQSDASGSVGEYRANPAYRPSARVLGWPEPTDPVDAAAQRAATGYGTVEEALAALAEADVTVVRGPDGGPLTAAGRDGAPVVLLFTSPAHEFMSSALHHDTLPARELARTLKDPGTMLMVNAGAAAPLLVPAESLPGPAHAAGDTWASAAEYVAAVSGTAEHVGTAPAEPSADRTASSSDQLPPTTGRTP